MIREYYFPIPVTSITFSETNKQKIRETYIPVNLFLNSAEKSDLTETKKKRVAAKRSSRNSLCEMTHYHKIPIVLGEEGRTSLFFFFLRCYAKSLNRKHFRHSQLPNAFLLLPREDSDLFTKRFLREYFSTKGVFLFRVLNSMLSRDEKFKIEKFPTV